MEPFARPLIAGNWKMNGLSGPGLLEIDRLCELVAGLGDAPEIAICPPATLLAAATARIAAKGFGGRIATGGQDCHPKGAGAHTGDISAAMLRDAGAAYCITGHSERRADHGETDALVAAKSQAVIAAGLTVIICVGETLTQREAGETLAVVRRQLAGSVPPEGNAANMVVAYEPVWAIGTGRTPTAADVGTVHAAMRQILAERAVAGAPVRLLYGGSVKPENAADLMAVAHVDGALVGGASLKTADFWPIIEAKR